MNKDIALEYLDFELTDNSNDENLMLRTLCYRNKKHSTNNTWLEIVFELPEREVHTYVCDMDGIVSFRVILTMDILQAIYNKCNELGWFDEII